MATDVPGDDTAPAGWMEIWRSGHVARFMVLCFGVWLHAADFALVATLLPDAVIEIGGAYLLNWNVALYQLGSIVAGVSTGILAIRYGLARSLIYGAAVYVVGCALSAIAPNMETILAGRVLQGLGGGFLVALVLVGVNDIFPSRMAPRVLAVVSIVWGSSAFIGPLIGGVFAEFGLWRAGFWAFGAQGIVFILAVWFCLRDVDKISTTAIKLPVRRLILLSLSVIAISWAGAISEAGRTDPMVYALAIAGLVMLILFFTQDGRAGDSRLLPRRAVDIRTRTGAGVALVLFFATATIPFTVYGPLLLKVLYGIGPLQAGYILALGSIAWTVGAVTFSGVSRTREGWVIVVGALLIAVSTIGLALAVPERGVLAILPFLFLEGAGFGMAYAFIVRRVVEDVRTDDRERAAAAMATVQEMGYALGAAACGIVANVAGFAEGISVVAARQSGFWLFAAFVPFGVLSVVLAWNIATRPQQQGEPS
ncbi:MAG: MFS transporter [Alphaproteobacteria bacterium]